MQSEKKILATEHKIQLIDELSETGLPVIEVGSFVSPKWVPQMANTVDVIAGIDKKEGCEYPVLVPNEKGFIGALTAQCEQIAVFTTASETFAQKNINCSIEESLDRYRAICQNAKDHHMKVRGYVSCAMGCPYEGDISVESVVKVSHSLLEMGCEEISISDTIGVGTAHQVQYIIEQVAQKVPIDKIAIHCHDTYGQALTNIYASLEKGVSVIDSSVAGLGGCPYAKGATGNVATEDVIYLLNGLGISSGVDLEKVIKAGQKVSKLLKREVQSKVSKALS